MTTDLTKMYLHLDLASEERTNFGFALTSESGETMFYQFRVLPFGLSTSTYIMQILTNPISYYLHEQGIDFSLFIDDSASISETWVKCYYSHLFIQHVFSCAGWQINHKKSSVLPKQMLVYLGFRICTVSMRISAPYQKLDKLCAKVEELLRKNRETGHVEMKQMASLLGGLCHLIYSHGNIVRLATRTLQHEGGKTVAEKGWTANITITPEMQVELKYIKKILYRYNSSPIKWERAKIEIIKPEKQTIWLDKIDPDLAALPRAMIVSDASLSSAYYYEADEFCLAREIQHEADEQEQSSSFRELLSVYKMMKTETDYLEERRGSLIVWFTDSQVSQNTINNVHTLDNA